MEIQFEQKGTGGPERTRTRKCHFENLVTARARKVSVPKCSGDPKRICPTFQRLSQNDVCEFECSQPSHGVGLELLGLEIPAAFRAADGAAPLPPQSQRAFAADPSLSKRTSPGPLQTGKDPVETKAQIIAESFREPPERRSASGRVGAVCDRHAEDERPDPNGSAQQNIIHTLRPPAAIAAPEADIRIGSGSFTPECTLVTIGPASTAGK
jgi:hypothetical protein